MSQADRRGSSAHRLSSSQWWRLGFGAAGLALLLTLGAAAAAQETPSVPRHPRFLSYPERTVEIPRAEPLTHRLANGTPVVVVEDHSLPLVDLVVALHAGSYLDPPELPGLAELTGAMIRRGGTATHDADAFDRAVDSLGAELDTRATGTRAGASLDCLVETLETCLELFFEMLRAPAFDAGRLAAIETNLLASFAARNDDPIAVMEREWSWLLVGEEHYLARQLTPADLERLDRASLRDFHARYWRPEEAVIAISGDVETERVLELLEGHVKRWGEGMPAASETDGDPGWPPRAAVAGSSPGIYLADHAAPQAKVSLGHTLLPITDWLSPDALALEVANEILGGTSGLVSRLNGRLRGKGWVYRALSEVDTGRYEIGDFRIFLDASPENVLRAIEVCLEEITRLRSAPPSSEELAIVAEELLSALVLRFDTAKEIAGYFAEDVLLGRPHAYWYGYAERLAALEPRDIRRAARRHLDPAALRILIVGGGVVPTGIDGLGPPLADWLQAPIRLPARSPDSLAPLEGVESVIELD